MSPLLLLQKVTDTPATLDAKRSMTKPEPLCQQLAASVPTSVPNKVRWNANTVTELLTKSMMTKSISLRLIMTAWSIPYPNVVQKVAAMLLVTTTKSVTRNLSGFAEVR